MLGVVLVWHLWTYHTYVAAVFCCPLPSRTSLWGRPTSTRTPSAAQCLSRRVEVVYELGRPALSAGRMADARRALAEARLGAATLADGAAGGVAGVGVDAGGGGDAAPPSLHSVDGASVGGVVRMQAARWGLRAKYKLGQAVRLVLLWFSGWLVNIDRYCLLSLCVSSCAASTFSGSPRRTATYSTKRATPAPHVSAIMSGCAPSWPHANPMKCRRLDKEQYTKLVSSGPSVRKQDVAGGHTLLRMLWASLRRASSSWLPTTAPLARPASLARGAL